MTEKQANVLEISQAAVDKIAEMMAKSLTKEDIRDIKRKFNETILLNDLLSAESNIGRMSFVSAYE